jgi:hypothetical protein
MSNSHFMHALRAVAPVALLFLAACSDKAQVANTTQEVMDTKNPGVVGAIENAVGYDNNIPEVQAALYAGQVVRDLENRDKYEAGAITARDKGDGKAALENIHQAGLAMLSHPDRNLYVTEVGIDLQYGDLDPSRPVSAFDEGGSVGAVRTRIIGDYADAKEGNFEPRHLTYANRAIAEVERAMQAISRMNNLTLREQSAREAHAADVAHEYYLLRSYIYEAKGDKASAEADAKRAKYYEQMQAQLKSPAAR